MTTLFKRIFIGAILTLRQWVTKLCPLHAILAVALLFISLPVLAQSSLSITGTPPTFVESGETIRFTPVVNGSNGNSLEFSITNKPSWAKFDSSTGTLQGNFSNHSTKYQGTYTDIEISVSDSITTATLAPFDLKVTSKVNDLWSRRFIDAGGSPTAIAINTLTNRIYVVNKLTDNVTVIDGDDNTTTVAVGSNPINIAIDSQSNQIYVVNSSSNNVTIIDGNNNQTTTIDMGDEPSEENKLTAIAINPQNKQIYVAKAGSNNKVIMIDSNNNHQTTTIDVGVGPTTIAINPQTNQIYVTNKDSNNVTVIDGNNNHQTTTINVGVGPTAIAINQLTNQIYVTNMDSNNVTVIDGNNNHQTTTIDVGIYPTAIAINQQTNQIYVANTKSYSVTIIDGNNNHQTTTIEVGRKNTDNQTFPQEHPQAIAINPQTNQIYVTIQARTSFPGSYIVEIDGNTLDTTIIQELRSIKPGVLAINPYTHQIYIVNTGIFPYSESTNNVTVMDGNYNGDDNLINSVAGYPMDIAINDNKIYVANYYGNVMVIDGSNNQISTVTVDKPSKIAINSQTDKIYVTHFNNNNVTVIDGSNNQIITPVTVGNKPNAIAVNSQTNRIYVTHYNNNNATVIDGSNNQIITPVTVGNNPIDIAINSRTNRIYVVNHGSDNVTVIDGSNNQIITTVALGENARQIAINQQTNLIYVLDYNNITVIDGDDNHKISNIVFPSYVYNFAINSQTNQIYANIGDEIMMFDDKLDKSSFLVDAGGAIIMNPQTDKIYIAASESEGHVMIMKFSEEVIHPKPLPVKIISPLSDDKSSLLIPPVVTFETTNDVAKIYYQITSLYESNRTTDWIAATLTDSRTGQATITKVPRGTNLLRVFATDEMMENTLNNAPGANSPFIGEISSYLFRVIPSPIVLDNSSDIHLTEIDEDTEASQNTGTSISDMLATAANGDPIKDGDYDAVEGIAVIAVDNTNGVWEYSIDNGTTWIAFGTPSNTEARLLLDAPNNRIRFQSNILNFNGTIENGVTFRAWEQLTGGGENGGIVNLTDTELDPYALSPDTETASITVTDTPEQFTNIYLETSAASILNTDSVNVAGKLSVSPETGESLKDIDIKLIITAPDGSNQIIKSIQTHTDTGQFELNDLTLRNEFTSMQDGAFGFQAIFTATAKLAKSKSAIEAVLVGASAGYAILIQGKIQNEEGLAAHKKTTNRIYKTLKKRKFEAPNIHYFNYNITNNNTTLNEIIIGDKTTPLVEKKPTKTGIQAAFTDIQGRMETNPAPFYIIMIDHGGYNGNFYIYGDNAGNNADDDVITPTQLAGWLDDFETGLQNANALKKPRIAILGYCYSGSFISELSQQPTFTNPDDPTTLVNAGRIIITSATAQEESYKGLNEPDGVRSGEFFMEEFFARLNKGDNFKQSFEFATEKTEIFTRKGGDTNAVNRFYDDAIQHPLLDDDGDGKGSNSLSADAESDGHQADGVRLGVGLNYDTNSADNPAEILSVSNTIYLSASEQEATLEIVVNDGYSVALAPVDIRKPTTVLSSNGTETNEQLEIPELSRVYMSCTSSNICTEEFDQFIEPGMYEAFYFVRDKETLDISPVRRSIIYKNKVDNLPPTAFNLKFPDANGKNKDTTEPKTTLHFVWEPSLDMDKDGPVTYNFILAKDPSFNEIVYQQEELKIAMTYVDETVGLEDNYVSPDDTNPEDDPPPYYWKVEAVDPFGERTSCNSVFSFRTNNSNTPPGVASLYISSALSFRPIDDAEILLFDENGDPLPDYSLYHEQGYYNMLLEQYGLRRAKIKVADYQEQEIEIDITHGTTQLNVEMIPIGGIPIQPGELQFAASVTSIDETEGTATILVERVNGNDGAISINYATSNGSAIAYNDYDNVGGTLNWLNQDERAKAINLPIMNDLDFEGDETLTITLSDPTNGAILGASQKITVTIIDDESAPEPVPGILQFSTSGYSGTEGNNTLNITVERTGGSDGQVSVQYMVNGTATLNTDYTGGMGTLTWSDGDSNARLLNLNLIDDKDVEKIETLNLTLFSPTGEATLGNPAQATLTITDNDEAGVAGVLQFSTSSYSIKEGDGTLNIIATRTDGNSGEVSVQHTTTSASTANSSDYTGGSGTLTWADGDSSNKSLILNITDDEEVEKPETIQLTLMTPTGEAALGSPSQTTITITDNDVAIEEKPEPITTPEPVITSNPVVIPVTPEPVAEPVVTPITPEPVVTTPAPVVNPELVTPITTPVIESEIVPSQSKVEILQFASTTYMAEESEGELHKIVVNRTGSSDGEVSVQYLTTIASTATFGLDFMGGSGMLVWANGDTQPKVLPITLLNDGEKEALETINLMLYNPSNQAVLGPHALTTLVIADNISVVSDGTNNDFTAINNNLAPGILQFLAPFYTTNEGIGNLTTFTVTRREGSNGKISVAYTTDGGSALLDYDYVGGTGELVWRDGDTTPKSIALMILDDKQAEDLETIPLILSEPTGGATLGVIQRASLIVVDNDGQTVHGTSQEDNETTNTSEEENEVTSNPEEESDDISSPDETGEVSSQKNEFVFSSLPSLGRGIAVTKDGSTLSANVLFDMVNLTVVFRGGVSINSREYQSNLTTTPSKMVKITGEIDIADVHIGQEADILVVIGIIDNGSIETHGSAFLQFLMLDNQEQFQVWEGEFATLVGKNVVLSETQTIEIYHGFIKPVQAQIYFGYRLKENGIIYFNGEQPIELQVTNEHEDSNP
ncbi:Calx-beta domain-containing protein [Candidatus Parabeggiatoa sp. HSG14]|uniref:Calx-beta domain-containing protein n=1 Tax=Candidatus Parabeggiatoa sp. HSG14 TaxID=3055593 RepID=UPI0025A7DEB4|nr:Calx-beta domain-containing protein [Thiotrichales bacterium HSG14]